MKQKKPKKKINKIVFCFSILMISIFYYSCKKTEKDLFLDKLYSKNNIFRIHKTDFTYKNCRLYQMNIPYPALHDSFISYNYFIFKNNIIYEISILNNCYQQYIDGAYVINDTLSSALNSCSIDFIPVIDFSLNYSDSLKLDKNHWTILKKKYNTKNDTIYKFIRNFGSEDRRTIIFASKREGFIGVYDSIIGQSIIINPIGKTFNGSNSITNFKTKKLEFDLNIFKEFNKN